MPPKKSKPKPVDPNSALADWPSPNPFDNENTNLLNPTNLKDHGFNSLNLSIPLTTTLDISPSPSPPIFVSPASEAAYLHTLRNKLWFAQEFIVTETELSLSPNRRLDKDPTAISLTQGPIPFSLYMQEVIRDSVNVRTQILELAKTKGVDDEAMQPLGNRFLWTWFELRGMLAGMVPGEDGQRERRAEEMMVDVMGDNLVERVEGGGEEGGA
jgi:hypothetical protein